MQTRKWIFRISSASAAFVVVTCSHGIGTHDQTIGPSQWGGVVRVLSNVTTVGNGTGLFSGTGTIIGNRDVNGQGWYCILTCDHVIRQGGKDSAKIVDPGAAQNNSLDAGGAATGNDGGIGAPVMGGFAIGREGIFGAGTNVDLALVAVNYGAYDRFNDLYVRSLVADQQFRTFTTIGYGNEGRLVPTGYQAQGKYGTQRYANGAVNRFATAFAGPGGYVFDAMIDKVLVRPPTVFPGSGTIFDGDSGSPSFIRETAREAGQDIDYFTKDVFAVAEGGQLRDPLNTGNQYFRDFGFDSFFVSLAGTTGTSDGANYISHIERVCATVPEPTTFGLMATGFVVLVLRRRRRS